MGDLVFLKGDEGAEDAEATAAAGEAALVESLRVEAATALERGLAFLKAQADQPTVLRAHVMLGAEPIDPLLAWLASRQRADGSIPSLGLASGGAPGLAAEQQRGLPEPVLGCLEMLIALSDLSALASASAGVGPLVEGAASYLEEQQLADGSWGVAERGPEERLFVTGMLSGLLGRTRVVRPLVLDGASDFLAEAWAPEQIEDHDWSTLAAFACFFSSVSHELADGALQWIGRELEKAFRTRRFDAAATLRVLLHCDATAVPGASLDAIELLRQTLSEQGADGGFAELSPEGPSARVEPTLDCMLGVIRLCGVL